MTNKIEQRREFNNEAIEKQIVFSNQDKTLTLKQYVNFREWYFNRCKELFTYNKNTTMRHFDSFFLVYGFNVLQQKTNGDEII
jgi:hypothetical protein